MGKRIKKLKKIRIHREGVDQLVSGFLFIVVVGYLLWHFVAIPWIFWTFIVVFGVLYGIAVNFYQCPIRYLNVEDTDGIVVAPADGKIVVIEEVNEDTLLASFIIDTDEQPEEVHPELPKMDLASLDEDEFKTVEVAEKENK